MAMRAPEETSIFSSTSDRPALGKSFAQLIDFSVLLSRYGTTEDQPPMMYDEERKASVQEEVCIMEVLSDRNGPCEGRWSTFEVLSNHEIRSRG